MREQVSVRPYKHDRYNWRVRYPDGGKRRQKPFVNKTGEKGADEWAAQKRKELADIGCKEESVTDAERRAVYEFREALRELPQHAQGFTLADAVKFYLKHLGNQNKSISCLEVTDAYLAYLKASNKSARHIGTTEVRLKRFNEEYGDWLACDVSTEIIDDFLQNLETRPRRKMKKGEKFKATPLSHTSMNNYRAAISGMFSHAVKLNAAKENPTAKALKPKNVSGEPGVLEPQELEALLYAIDDDSKAGLAISFFAGLRRSEIEALDWSNINLDEDTIVVTAAAAKKDRRRTVKISPNLKKWLTPLYKRRGKLVPSHNAWRYRIEKARKLAGITNWPQNAGRHSFASYHLALHEDAGKTSFELGHLGGSRLLYDKYRALVSKKAAKAYWQISPKKAGTIISLKSA